MIAQFLRSEHRAPRVPALLDLADLIHQPRGENEAAIRAACTSSYLGGRRALVRVLGRYKLLVDTDDFDIAAHLLLDGFWEYWVTAALARLVRPGMTCVDVGAHLGYFTLLMADLAGPQGCVHAVEPNPRLRELLGQSLRVNGFAARVRVHGVALSDVDDAPVDLVVPPGQSGGGYVVPAEGGGMVRTRRMDALDGLSHVDFVKIDAEASEERIWRGMRALLDRGAPLTVAIEFTTARYADPAGFLSAMLDEGFSLAVIDADSGIRPATAAQVLEAPAAADQMLVLRR